MGRFTDVAHETTAPARKNIQAILDIEKEALDNRSAADHIIDTVSIFAGSKLFVFLHILGFAAWIVLNQGWIPGVRPFDPYPFSFLTFVVSLEAIFLSTFVLITQNRMSSQAEKWNHLDLQINLLAEQEMTMALQMLEKICERLDLQTETDIAEARKLMEKTDVHELVNELSERLPNHQ